MAWFKAVLGTTIAVYLLGAVAMLDINWFMNAIPPGRIVSMLLVLVGAIFVRTELDD